MLVWSVTAAAQSAVVAPSAPPDQFFDSNGVRIRYVEQGQGPAIVLMHGYTGTLGFFIDAPISDRTRESGPFVGASITGTRRDVLIQDDRRLRPRVPAAADSPRQPPCPHPRAVRSVLQPRHREPDDGAHDARA